MPYKNIEDKRRSSREWARRKRKEDPTYKKHEWRDFYRSMTPEEKKKWNRYRRLKPSGWTAEAYSASYEKQKGLCAICGEKPKINKGNTAGNLSADHEHTIPPKPRSLLCQNCNAGLGLFKDDPNTLEKAFKYLRYWGKK